MKTINHGKRQNFTYRVGEKLNGLLTLFLIVVALSLSMLCSAEENAPDITQNSASYLPIPDLKEIEVSGPYCGIYSLIACFHVYGITPDIKTLLVPDYVGSFQGSSNQELIKAAEAHGLYGKTYGNLTWRDLQKSQTPMILHFRSSYADAKFNHWVTYLGTSDGKAQIIDVPHELATIPFAELMAKWDGTAIAISDKPIAERFLSTARVNYLWFVVFLFGGMFLIQKTFWNPSKEPSAAPTFALRMKYGVIQTACLLGLVFVVAVLYHATSKTGFLRNPAAVAEVTRRYYSVDIPEISLAEMQKIVEEKTTPIFDARYLRDYHYGTISGAKTLSINSSLDERQRQMQGIGKEQKIVVFCQSSGCTYSDEIAQFLKFNRYNKVVIYRGGYREWEKHEKKHGRKP